MAVTRLKRKALRNRVKAKNRVERIQRLSTKPVIENVDVEEIKKQFASGDFERPVDFPEKESNKVAKAKPAKKETEKKAEKPKAEKKETSKTEKAEVKQEKQESKPAAKAETKKAEPKEEAVEEDTVDIDALIESIGKATAKEKDDLKEINGIGPAFEKRLNGIGVYTYDQISKLKKKDIENLGNLDGLSADKIESEEWVKNAKELKKAKK